MGISTVFTDSLALLQLHILRQICNNKHTDMVHVARGRRLQRDPINTRMQKPVNLHNGATLEKNLVAWSRYHHSSLNVVVRWLNLN